MITQQEAMAIRLVEADRDAGRESDPVLVEMVVTAAITMLRQTNS